MNLHISGELGRILRKRCSGCMSDSYLWSVLVQAIGRSVTAPAGRDPVTVALGRWRDAELCTGWDSSVNSLTRWS